MAPWRLDPGGAIVATMTVDARPDVQLTEADTDPVTDLVNVLRPRLEDLPEASLRDMVTSVLDEFGEVRVTTYLPILVERRVRDELRHGAPEPHAPAKP